MRMSKRRGLGCPRPARIMKVHLINPSSVSFGTAVITPRWLYVLAGATPAPYGDPHLVDETLAAVVPTQLPLHRSGR